jgi:dCMP deaminase
MTRIDTWDEYFLRLAYLVAQRSRDPKTRIGSVLTRDNAIIATGYNSFPRLVQDLPERYENRELKRQMVSHSEENTILTSARLGVKTEGTTIFTFGHPCHICAKALIQGGVTHVVLHKQWPNMSFHPSWHQSFELADLLFKEAAVNVRFFDKVLGVKGLLDGKEIEV